MAEENSILVKNWASLSDQEYAELKGEDGDASTLSSSDIVIIIEKARSENPAAIAILEKFGSRTWFRYDLKDAESAGDILCTANLAVSKETPSMNEAKKKELQEYAAQHALLPITFDWQAPNAADIMWTSMIGLVAGGTAGYEAAIKRIEEEKKAAEEEAKRLATVEGLAGMLKEAGAQLTTTDKQEVIKKAAEYFSKAPLDIKKKLYPAMKEAGITGEYNKELLMGAIRDIDDDRMYELYLKLLKETHATRELFSSLLNSTIVERSESVPERASLQLKALKLAALKYYKDNAASTDRNVGLDSYDLLTINRLDDTYFLELMNKANEENDANVAPYLWLAIDMFCAMARVNRFKDIEIEFVAMMRLVDNRLLFLTPEHTNMALIDRLAEALAAIYLEFDLFYSFDSNRLIMKHIVDLAKDVGSLDASPQSCTDGYYGYYGLHTFQLYCKYIDWLLKRSK